MDKFGLLGEQRIPNLIDRRVRRDSMAQQTGGDLGDDSDRGGLHQLGELRPDERRSEQRVGGGVNDQFRPSLETVPEKRQA